MVKKLSRRLLLISIVGITVIFGTLLFHFVDTGSTFVQKAELSIGPDPANPGTTITVTGFNYPANQTVEVYFQNRLNGIVRTLTNASGSFNASLTLPREYIDGRSFVYTACGETITKRVLRFIKPSLTLTPTNSMILNNHPDAQFKGEGFVANERVDLALTVNNKTTRLGNAVTDDQGRFTYALATRNISFDSTASLTTTDTSRQVTIPLALHPSIQTNPLAGHIGSTINIFGSGFGRSEAVRVLFQDRVVTTVGTNHNGAFHTSFHVPRYAQVSYYYNSIHVYGIRTRAGASSSFQVLPLVDLRPDTGSPGQSILAIGSQFTPNGPISIHMIDPDHNASDVGIPLRFIAATSGGIFRTYFKIPNNAQINKTYSVLFIDEGSGVSSVAYIGIT
jgi:hypothetical protein